MTYFAIIKTNKLGERRTTEIDAATPEEAKSLINEKIKGFATIDGEPFQSDETAKGYKYFRNSKYHRFIGNRGFYDYKQKV